MENNSKDKKKITPMVKWVGGKGNVIQIHLKSLLPKNFNNYYEIFCGGGSMLLYLQPFSGVINDINKELIITYKIIRDDIHNLMKKLDKYKENHSEELFYKTRKKIEKTNLNIAARFIYLNKTCFNGMYRVNSNGFFNVPFNGVSKEKLNLYKKENLILFSNYLNNNNIQITNLDYLKVLEMPRKNDFIFVDSPYDYEIGTKGFDAYSSKGFNQKNQLELFLRLNELKLKIYWLKIWIAFF